MARSPDGKVFWFSYRTSDALEEIRRFADGVDRALLIAAYITLVELPDSGTTPSQLAEESGLSETLFSWACENLVCAGVAKFGEEGIELS